MEDNELQTQERQNLSGMLAELTLRGTVTILRTVDGYMVTVDGVEYRGRTHEPSALLTTVADAWERRR